MNRVLQKHDHCSVVYLDDVLVHSPTAEAHVRDLRGVLECLRLEKLQAKRSKCTFAQREVEFLGHVVSDAGVKPDPRKVQAVAEWPTLKSTKDIQQFLGLANYYNRFISGFAKLAAPLTNLLGTKVPWVWEAAQSDAFDSLKKALCAAPVLCLPDLAGDFVLETDASDNCP